MLLLLPGVAAAAPSCCLRVFLSGRGSWHARMGRVLRVKSYLLREADITNEELVIVKK
jgi:hypothetical protein